MPQCSSYPRRDDVERSNNTRMRAIDTETHTYKAFDGGPLSTTDTGHKMLENFMAPASLTLKLGAQVMLIKNLDESLVNGSMGSVTEFSAPQDFMLNPDDPYDDAAGTGSGSKPSSKVGKPNSKAGKAGEKKIPTPL